MLLDRAWVRLRSGTPRLADSPVLLREPPIGLGMDGASSSASSHSPHRSPAPFFWRGACFAAGCWLSSSWGTPEAGGASSTGTCLAAHSASPHLGGGLVRHGAWSLPYPLSESTLGNGAMPVPLPRPPWTAPPKVQGRDLCSMSSTRCAGQWIGLFLCP